VTTILHGASGCCCADTCIVNGLSGFNVEEQTGAVCAASTCPFASAGQACNNALGGALQTSPLCPHWRDSPDGEFHSDQGCKPAVNYYFLYVKVIAFSVLLPCKTVAGLAQ